MNKQKTLSETELLKAIESNTGLDEAIRQIYREHAAAASSFLIGQGASQQDADDIFQDTVVSFIHTVQKGKFRQESGIRTFLISISKHLWYNEIRRQQRAERREKVFELDRNKMNDGFGELTEELELQKQMQLLVSELGDSCRKILMLFYYENFSMKEIVGEMHYENEQVVRNKKYKCLQQLTDKMKKNPAASKQISELINR